MEYNMNSRKLESTIENAEYRSVYGDMHAHRDAEMRKENVARMRAAGQIDEHMSTELLKPLDKKIAWTTEFFSAFPDYTGQQPDMVPFETAERHRRKCDKEMLKIVEDYEAGRIDEDGNRIHQDGDDDASEIDSDSSRLSDVTECEDRTDAHPTIGDKSPALRSRSSSSTSVPKPSVAPASASLAPSEAQTLRVKPSRPTRKRPEKIDPLQPLAGGKDYLGYTYNQLVAVGRERGIYTPGGAQEVRNALIQDDINVAQGLERNIAEWKKNVGLYKSFKTEVPAELKTKVSNEPEEG